MKPRRDRRCRAVLVGLIAVAGCARLNQGLCTLVAGEPLDLSGRALAVRTLDEILVVDESGRRAVLGSEGADGFAWDWDGTGLFVTRGGALIHLPLEGGAWTEIEAHWTQVRFPSVSPNGEWLAVSANFSEDVGLGWEIWVLRRTGSDPRFVAPGYNPSWSPDGSTLFFEQYEPSTQLVRHDLLSGQTTPLLDEPGRDISIEVSPRGSFAAFSRGHERRLMLYDLLDEELVTLTDGTAYDQYPSFSASEEYIAFQRQMERADSVALQVVVCELTTGRTWLVEGSGALEAAFARIEFP